MSNKSSQRHPIAMLHVGLPLTEVNEWSSDEAIAKAMAKRVKEVSFPEDAYVQVWFAFLPESNSTAVYNVQKGFYEVEGPTTPHISEVENES